MMNFKISGNNKNCKNILYKIACLLILLPSNLPIITFYAKISNMEIINIKDTSNKLYYVGGVVRDELLGRESFDIDMTYEGNAIEFVQNNLQGIEDFEIVQVNEPFGTVRVKVSGREIDIASTREEVYEKKGHLPSVTKIGCSLKEDTMRRDFTINALYKSAVSGEIIDLTGGLDDLKNKTIRVLHNGSFIDDPTRIIRGLKFSIRFGFELDEHTKKLQDDYLNNINYDMCCKRVKKELIETFNLNSQSAFEKFIRQKIYKLVTEKDVSLPQENIEELIKKYPVENVWLVYIGCIGDLSRLPLTKNEQKILDDFNATGELKNDFEIYKAFEKVSRETVLLYGILKDKSAAERYLETLSRIKIEITGEDLLKLGLKPSKKFSEIFDYVLKKKLENPNMTKEDEINAIKGII